VLSKSTAFFCTRGGEFLYHLPRKKWQILRRGHKVPAGDRFVLSAGVSWDFALKNRDFEAKDSSGNPINISISVRTASFRLEEALAKKRPLQQKTLGKAIVIGFETLPLGDVKGFHWLQTISTRQFVGEKQIRGFIDMPAAAGKDLYEITVPEGGGKLILGEYTHVDRAAPNVFYDEGGFSWSNKFGGSLFISDRPTGLPGDNKSTKMVQSFDDFLINGNNVYYHVHWERWSYVRFGKDGLVSGFYDVIKNISGERVDRLPFYARGTLVDGQRKLLVGYSKKTNASVYVNHPISNDVIKKWEMQDN
jgi:hypothetical protein